VKGLSREHCRSPPDHFWILTTTDKFIDSFDGLDRWSIDKQAAFCAGQSCIGIVDFEIPGLTGLQRHGWIHDIASLIRHLYCEIRLAG
jgi:hypothetical protein